MVKGRTLPLLTVFFATTASVAWAVWGLLRTQTLAPASWWTALADMRGTMTGAALVTGLTWTAFRATRAVRQRQGRDSLRSVSQLQTIIAVVIAIAVAALAFGDLSATLLSLGLVGFGLTLALQRPILALAGWATIFFGTMFREGDRIQVRNLEGDVIGITLFTTRLWELGAEDSRTPGRPTGRLRTVSNAEFLEHPVANATSDTPIVFDEFVVNVAYEADQQRAEEILLQVGASVLDIGRHEAMATTYRRLARGLKMETTFPEHPFVLAESKASWMEYRLRYLVNARSAATVQADLTRAWNQATQDETGILPIYPRTQTQRFSPDGRAHEP